MTNPMYCPMAFANERLCTPRWSDERDEVDGSPKLHHVEYHRMECTPDCAWAVKEIEHSMLALLL